MAETPDDGRLGSKHVAKRSDRNSCITDGIMLCMKDQVYCLCLGPELVSFNMDPYFEYDYITCNIMLGNKTLGIIYCLDQLCWY
jgi:hypothetical protein